MGRNEALHMLNILRAIKETLHLTNDSLLFIVTRTTELHALFSFKNRILADYSKTQMYTLEKYTELQQLIIIITPTFFLTSGKSTDAGVLLILPSTPRLSPSELSPLVP